MTKMTGFRPEHFLWQVEGKVARLTTLLSPIIIITMAVVVVFIVFSILQPILDMQNFVS